MNLNLNVILLVVAVSLVILLTAIWWLRRGRRGLNWVLLAVPLAFAASYLSSYLFHVPDYQAGCDGICTGWWGYPLPTHLSDGAGPPDLMPLGLAANAAIYYAGFLFAGMLVTLAADALHYSERSRRWRLAFLLLAVLVPLALAPAWLPPPTPDLPPAQQRLAINAARAWRWQLQFRRFSDRRLAVEDVRLHPDGKRHRVCFRIYTWFYIPLDRLYVDLEPAGVRSTGGGVIPLTASCWVQP